MNKKEKLDVYFKHQDILRKITNKYYYKYKRSLNLSWTEIKQTVDLEFFKLIRNKIILKEEQDEQDFVFGKINNNVHKQIRDLYLTNKAGKRNKEATKWIIDEEKINSPAFYQGMNVAILDFVLDYNLTAKEHKFLYDWSLVDFSKRKLLDTSKYAWRSINHFQDQIKHKYLTGVKNAFKN